MLLLLMTIDKEECQTVNTQKDDNHKISHTISDLWSLGLGQGQGLEPQGQGQGLEPQGQGQGLGFWP